MVHTTVNEGIDTLTYYTGIMAGDRKRSDDNPYIDWLNDMRVTFYEEADYGNDWAGGGSGVDVATTFPASPSKGVSFLRLNTNTSELRLYYYNGSSWVAINQSDQIQVDVVPSPTPTYSTLQDVMDTLHSAGIISGGTITDGGSETIDVAAGTGAIKIADSEIANLRFLDWAAETGLSIPTDTTRHVGIDYNSGSPQVLLSATLDTFNDHDKLHLGGIVNEGGTLHIQNIPHEVVSGVGHTIDRFLDTEHFQRGSGLILGESGDGNRYVTVTAGTIWERLTQFTPSAVDTNPGGGADSFDIYYRDGGSGFTKVSSQTIWDNNSYDDNSGVLQTMTTNWYAQIWFYIELDGELVAQYGRSEAATLAMVESEAPPVTAPDRITEHALLIGRILFQNGGTTPQDVQSVFEQAFNSAGVFDHGGLAGLLDNDHTQYLLIADIDDTPVDSETLAPISSNWAYDHQNNPTDINHITDAQLAALHPAVTTLAHSALSGKNSETDIKHLTDAQLSALHPIYTDENAVDAVEGVSNAPIATGDSVIFTDVSDSGNLKKDLVSDLLALGGVKGQYTIILSPYAHDVDGTHSTYIGSSWGGGSFRYITFTSTGQMFWSLGDILPSEVAGNTVRIDSIEAFFWASSRSSGGINVIWYDYDRTDVNAPAVGSEVSTTWVLVAGSLTYKLQITNDITINTAYNYTLYLNNIPSSEAARPMGIRIIYSVI